MKTIEDIKVEKTFYTREKDVFGNVTRTPYQKMVRRAPEVVTPGVRFGYYLIDLVFFYILQIIFGVIIGIILVATKSLELLESPIFNLISLLIFFFYYSIFEGFTGGSLGKLICGYVVIDEQAERIKFSTAMLRTVCRMVPFEAFSCFGERGWHDKWSKTYVVKKSEQQELKKLLGTGSDSIEILD